MTTADSVNRVGCVASWQSVTHGWTVLDLLAPLWGAPGIDHYLADIASVWHDSDRFCCRRGDPNWFGGGLTCGCHSHFHSGVESLRRLLRSGPYVDDLLRHMLQVARLLEFAVWSPRPHFEALCDFADLVSDIQECIMNRWWGAKKFCSDVTRSPPRHGARWGRTPGVRDRGVFGQLLEIFDGSVQWSEDEVERNADFGGGLAETCWERAQA